MQPVLLARGACPVRSDLCLAAGIRLGPECDASGAPEEGGAAGGDPLDSGLAAGSLGHALRLAALLIVALLLAAGGDAWLVHHLRSDRFATELPPPAHAHRG